eukprot:SRR837773.11973.p2 GENE.SRR837773.11973~~SRR837773.11973.p2  ORF type:complete len:171 (-),score=35.77 SRR837773.11973:49-531(-)
MYGLRGINNVYVPSGQGRDSIIAMDPDYRFGKAGSGSAPSMAAGRPCLPRRERRDAPPYVSLRRIETLHRGQHSLVRKEVPRAYSVPQLRKTWSSMPGASEVRSCCLPAQSQRSPLAEAALAAGAGSIAPKASNASWSGVEAVKASAHIMHQPQILLMPG